MKSNVNRYGLTNDAFYTIINIFKNYTKEVERVILFGSRARGDYKITSDIDLAVVTRHGSDITTNIKDDLSEANIIHTVDVIDYHKISNSKLKNYIDSEGVTIFSTNSKGEVVGNMNKISDRLIDLERAIKKLHESLERDATKDDIVIDANIQRFEFTYELSWKIMKAFLEFSGVLEVASPRKTIREAFKNGLITKDDAWLKMLEDRNRTSNTYDEAIAMEIYKHIKDDYIHLFDSLITELKKRIDQ
ncbi:HI0074 family nucleotidyltransferase substrate-binding subunit [Falsibacillus pallidus]|uniref:HI0074 family nucleotidyltransferase substrate-binding subunit n=1 Tax=Falsibacillus pallidus TaxID=493781 RepID=UPI003D983981